jgi:uncharacterized protein YxeA
MRKIISIIAIIAALSVPAAAYASQSINIDGNSGKTQEATQNLKADNHDYRQPVWLDSSDNGHYYEPQLWL